MFHSVKVNDTIATFFFNVCAIAVTIQFMPTTYTVMESDLVVEVCVSAPGPVGLLSRPVTYSVQTSDDSATGKFML